MLFDQMRCGLWDEGTATLRMKMDLLSPNPNMWDHAAYRIMFSAHPHAKDKWCIYPTYDYTHCLVDSIENVTHSMCTLEFETRQSKDGSYHWLVDALGLYHSYTWEYSRCSISHNVLSKRRLNILATGGYVNGWDDPRLLTLEGLRRRGYTPSAINEFCRGLGVARSSNTVCVSKCERHISLSLSLLESPFSDDVKPTILPSETGSGQKTRKTQPQNNHSGVCRRTVLENCIRNELDVSAHRCFACLKPIKVTIANHKPVPACNIPNHPYALKPILKCWQRAIIFLFFAMACPAAARKRPAGFVRWVKILTTRPGCCAALLWLRRSKAELGTREMEFTPVVYIDSSDFRETDSKDYYGLAKGKTVRLLHCYDITCKEVKKSNGVVTELVCEFDINSLKEKPPKGKIGWVSEAAVPCTVNRYEQLFNMCDIEVVRICHVSATCPPRVRHVSAASSPKHKQMPIE